MSQFSYIAFGILTYLIPLALGNTCPGGGSVLPRVKSWTGPIIPGVKFGEPSILKNTDGTYYVYSTSHSPEGVNVPFAFSKTLPGEGNWNITNPSTSKQWDAMPTGASNPGLGAWTKNPHGDSDVWNPDVSKLPDGSYVIYYSARSKKGGKGHGERCIGVGHATDPKGPFTPKDTPFFCPKSGGAIGIDGIYDEVNNKRYVLFKSPSCPGDVKCNPKIQIIEVDVNTGLRIPTQKSPKILTESIVHQPGEESPALTRMCDNRWLLLHTEGSYKVNYTIAYAISKTTDIMGDYNDYHTRYLIKDGDESEGPLVYVPGGPDFVGHSNTRFVFHARPSKHSNQRVLYYGEMEYVADS